MERVVASSVHEQIEELNVQIGKLAQSARSALAGEAGFGAEDVQALSTLVHQMNPMLARSKELKASEPGTAEQLGIYITQIRELQITLDSLKIMLIGRRDQIDQGREQFEAVSHWVDAFRQTQ